MAFDAVPPEVRACPQWILWRPEALPDRKKLTKIPISAIHGGKAATDKPADWTSFENAYARAEQYKGQFGLGFVFGYASGVSGVDLDNVLSTDGTVLDYNAVEIARKFSSYTELSPSRTGLHVLLKANIPAGRRHRNVEVYGQGRYFTITGESYGPALPLASRQAEADELVGSIDQLRAKNAPGVLDWSIAPKYTNDEVMRFACNADNGEKFWRLWNGDWQSYYGSQSEADYALINIIAFYTDSPWQVQQMFLASALGQRDKARTRQGYVVGMIQHSFDRKPVAVLPAVAALQMPVAQPVVAEEIEPANDDEHLDDDELQLTDEEKAARDSDPYILPPGGGLLADAATFIYEQAPYPLKEAALAASLAFMAGICGRQYQIESSGLNLFVIVLANTGSGKEAMSTGIGKLFDAVCNPKFPHDAPPGKGDAGFPAARGFRGPARLTGKGLMTSLAKSDTLSFVSVLTEFAYTLDQMKEGSKNTGQQEMRQTLLDLYMKSSAGNSFAGHVTADKDTTIKSIASPAFTLLAESTPGRLYKLLDDDMITSGLLPRMVVIETNNITERHNPGHGLINVPPHVEHNATALCHQVLAFKQANTFAEVTFTPDGKEVDEQFRVFCRRKLRANSDSTNELWNRAHLNARRMAALAAIGQNMSAPTINGALFNWSSQIVYRQTTLLVMRFAAGLTGGLDLSEAEEITKVRQIIAEYKSWQIHDMPRTYRRRYGAARQSGVIGYSYLMTKCTQLTVFRADKRGIGFALRTVIETLKKTGELTPASLVGHPGEYYKLT